MSAFSGFNFPISPTGQPVGGQQQQPQLGPAELQALMAQLGGEAGEAQPPAEDQGLLFSPGGLVGGAVGALEGAAVGSFFPGVGTVLGAAIGAGIGLLGGPVGLQVGTGLGIKDPGARLALDIIPNFLIPGGGLVASTTKAGIAASAASRLAGSRNVLRTAVRQAINTGEKVNLDKVLRATALVFAAEKNPQALKALQIAVEAKDTKAVGRALAELRKTAKDPSVKALLPTKGESKDLVRVLTSEARNEARGLKPIQTLGTSVAERGKLGQAALLRIPFVDRTLISSEGLGNFIGRIGAGTKGLTDVQLATAVVHALNPNAGGNIAATVADIAKLIKDSGKVVATSRIARIISQEKPLVRQRLSQLEASRTLPPGAPAPLQLPQTAGPSVVGRTPQGGIPLGAPTAPITAGETAAAAQFAGRPPSAGLASRLAAPAEQVVATEVARGTPAAVAVGKTVSPKRLDQIIARELHANNAVPASELAKTLNVPLKRIQKAIDKFFDSPDPRLKASLIEPDARVGLLEGAAEVAPVTPVTPVAPVAPVPVAGSRVGRIKRTKRSKGVAPKKGKKGKKGKKRKTVKTAMSGTGKKVVSDAELARLIGEVLRGGS